MKGTHSLFQLALENQAAGSITAPPNLLSAEHRQVWNANSSGQETRTLQDWITHRRQRLERQVRP